MKNGYFQLICSQTGTAVKIVAPQDGGANVFVREVMDYLNLHGVTYDVTDLNKGLQDAKASGQNEYSFSINTDVIPEIGESYRLTVSPNKMTVIARFYPPSSQGENLKQEELLSDLQFKKITTGIRNEEIDRFFETKEYCTDFVVAQGKIPRNGTDGRIEYYFATDLKAKPALKEDGSVDFFHLDVICHCNKGDVLARLFPEDPGDPGLTVYGEKVKPRDVKRVSLKYGHNIILSEDKQVLTADVDGHVTLVDDKVFVSNVLEVENVDIATGNIDYEGSIMVNGNICTNFQVRAKGNIEVKGVVEGAFVEAGGDIIIARGVNGMARGILKAGGNVVSKYIENAKVTAGGYISTEAILHSEVGAGSEITVTGKKGFITGGKVTAGNLVQVKTLGSAMGADTIVAVGVDPSLKAKMDQLQRGIAEDCKVIAQIHPVLTAANQKLAQGIELRPELMKNLQDMIQKENQIKQKIDSDTKEYNELKKMLDESNGARVEVMGEVFAGTRISISDVSLVVKTSMSYCRFIKEHGDVKMTAL